MVSDEYYRWLDTDPLEAVSLSYDLTTPYRTSTTSYLDVSLAYTVLYMVFMLNTCLPSTLVFALLRVRGIWGTGWVPLVILGLLAPIRPIIGLVSPL